MTVEELINELKGWNKDMVVVIQGYESGYDDFQIVPGDVNSRVVDWWNGRYEETIGGTRALMLRRTQHVE